MSEPIRAVVSDFGGVLTTPLMNAFANHQDRTGIPAEALGRAMQSAADRAGVHPLFELEKGNITEGAFLSTIADELERELGHRPEMHGFKEIFFEALEPNEPMLDLMRRIKASGRRMALLTNNVREWEPLWRTMMPIDEIFEVVVDSGFVGMRKPEPEIYELTLERLGDGISAGDCLFVDDVAVNIDAAQELGFRAVHFRDNEQAIAEVEAALGLERAPG